MAKTIKDMANRYCEGSSFENSVMEMSAYIAGANAVLEEVEKAIDLGKYPDLISPTEALFKVTQLVIRLKG